LGRRLAGRRRLGIGSVVDPASLNVAERQFVERMRDVSPIGSFTTAGRETRTPAPDRYDIFSVEKVGADPRRFNAKMGCGGVNGATLPIVVSLRWIGDTPVIMMTDTSLKPEPRRPIRLTVIKPTVDFRLSVRA
jgi:hypothetical protein